MIPKLFEGWCPELGEFSSRNDSVSSITLRSSEGVSEILDSESGALNVVVDRPLSGLNSSSISAIQQ